MAGLPPTQLVMGIIGVLSFFCNGALCLVVLRKRSMLKSSYNLVIFTLAVTDTLTGNILPINNIVIINYIVYNI